MPTPSDSRLNSKAGWIKEAKVVLSSDLKNTSELPGKSSNSYEQIIKNTVEVARVAADPILYLTNYVYLQNKNTGQIIKWKPWPYLVDLMTILQSSHEVVIIKARQLGFTWTVAAYGEHKAKFSEAAKALYLSQKEGDAWDFLGKSKFVWEHSPSFLMTPILHDSRGWIKFEGGGEIMALPSTDNAGRGTDATLVVRDELANHPFAATNYTAISPSIDSGGQLIDLSTINKLDPSNHFTERVERAWRGAHKRVLKSGLEVYTGGESKAVLIFAGWKLRPVRQEGMTLEEWFETRIKPKYSPFQIEQEYPETLVQALKPSETRAFFDVKALEDMLMQVQSPLRNVDFDTHNGMVRVYKPPITGRQYIIFTDPSMGIEDPFVTVVMDSITGEGVCSATGMIPAAQVGAIHDQLVRNYNNAFNSGEVNAQAGQAFIDALTALNTPNVAPRRTVEGKIIRDRKGWVTAKPMRDKALGDLKEAVRTQLITVHDRDAIEEFRHFIVIGIEESGKVITGKVGSKDVGTNKVKAVGKLHDDWIMAWAGAWQIRKYAPLASGLVAYSGQYKG